MRSLKRVALEACVEYLAPRALVLIAAAAVVAVVIAPWWALVAGAVIGGGLAWQLRVKKKSDSFSQVRSQSVARKKTRANRHYTQIAGNRKKKKNAAGHASNILRIATAF